MDACEPHATPFVSVLWLLDRSASYFTLSTFHFLRERSRVASRMATLPGSHQHAFSPAFATCRIYSGGGGPATLAVSARSTALREGDETSWPTRWWRQSGDPDPL